MDLEFTEEQEMLRDMVRGVCSSYSSLETVRGTGYRLRSDGGA